MVDYGGELARDVPNIDVEATVGEQWSTGVSLVQQLHAEKVLGSTVVIGLGTNGPISNSDFNEMMMALASAQRIIFVTVHVDRPWQNGVNALLRQADAHSPKVAIADWNALASNHPDWFYSDGTHLPIGGPGAQAIAALVAKTIRTAAKH